MGASYLWQRGESEVGVFEAGHEVLASDDYLNSPSRVASERGKTLHRHLTGPKAKTDYTILEKLRDEGATDYICLPVEFTIAGRPSAVSVATDHPDGFTAEQIDRMNRLRPLFARVCESHLLRDLSATLLDTYVGHEAGERILRGEIRRGVGETIQAVICSFDLRNFTPMSDALPRDELIALLNAYFECIGTAVADNGGEILKFIGDSVPASFKVRGPTGADEVCRTATTAARQAMATMEAFNQERWRPTSTCPALAWRFILAM